MQNEPLRTDVAVVGAGIAGLTAAQLLRRAGHSVVVLDHAPAGGRGRTDVRGAVHFNRGPHALYLNGPAHRVLSALQVPLHGGPPASDGAGLRGGRVGVLPYGPAALARTDLLGVRGKVAIARSMARLPKLDATALAGMSFAEWLDGESLPADARQLVEMLARVATYTNAPDIAAADMVVGQVQMAMRHGVRYLDGGWQTVVDELTAGLQLERAVVAAVRRDGPEVVVELAERPPVVAKAAVVAVGTPEVAARLLQQPRYAVGPAVEASCLDLAADVPARPGLLFGVDSPLYLSNHCPPARLAPDGVHVVHVARYLRPGEHIDQHEGRAELMAHAARAGLTAEHVLDSRFLHRLTVVGGMAAAEHGGLPGRPAVGATGHDGVFLAGDWVGPTGHLLDAVVASAEAAAQRADRAVRGATLVSR